MGAAAELDARFRRRFWRILLASALMGVVLWVAGVVLTRFLGEPGLRYAALAALVAIGMGTYFAAGRALGAFSMADLRGALRR
jgi:putative peptidoglycan lipid II flippase